MNLVVEDPVVRLTCLTPIANRRRQAHRNAIARQRPAGGMQRGVNRGAATTRTQVLNRAVSTTDIKLAGI